MLASLSIPPKGVSSLALFIVFLRRDPCKDALPGHFATKEW